MSLIATLKKAASWLAYEGFSPKEREMTYEEAGERLLFSTLAWFAGIASALVGIGSIVWVIATQGYRALWHFPLELMLLPAFFFWLAWRDEQRVPERHRNRLNREEEMLLKREKLERTWQRVQGLQGKPHEVICNYLVSTKPKPTRREIEIRLLAEFRNQVWLSRRKFLPLSTTVEVVWEDYHKPRGVIARVGRRILYYAHLEPFYPDSNPGLAFLELREY